MLEGTILITGLPPHRGLIINLCFFAVTGADSPPPHNGDPPADAATDCAKLFSQVDLNKESQQTTFEHRFGVNRSAGYYYLQLRVILFWTRREKVLAQTEQFFFARQPVHIGAEPADEITLPASWPLEPLETLHQYGTVIPKTKRRWWRFW